MDHEPRPPTLNWLMDLAFSGPDWLYGWIAACLFIICFFGVPFILEKDRQ